MKYQSYDVGIVGGGIVGLATAFQLQSKFPHLRIVVFEKEKELAFHQTGRNSGVIHSGLYYNKGSFRAKNCVAGRKQLLEFAKNYNIPHDVCGKVVVAVNRQEEERLDQLKINGENNQLVGLKMLDSIELKYIEPYVEGLKALWVPESGIIDYRRVTEMFAKEVISINNQSVILKSCQVIDVKEDSLLTTKGKYNVKHVVFCGGLFSDRLAKKDKLNLNMQIVGFRGDYYELANHARFKINNLIYPVPHPDFPFLGVHFTRMINGSIECGPNAVFTFKREGYSKTSFDLYDTLEALSFPGTRKLFINNWKFGLNEYKRAFSKSLFLNQLRKMLPSINMNDIIVSRSGVRAIALSKDGKIIDDFKILRNKNNIHVLNAPSPAATACLSIADYIIKEACDSFNF